MPRCHAFDDASLFSSFFHLLLIDADAAICLIFRHAAFIDAASAISADSIDFLTPDFHAILRRYFHYYFRHFRFIYFSPFSYAILLISFRDAIFFRFRHYYFIIFIISPFFDAFAVSPCHFAIAIIDAIISFH